MKAYYRFITVSLIVVFAISCRPDGTETASPGEEESRISAAIAKADALFPERSDFSKLSEMTETLRRVRNPDKRDFEVEWRFSRASYYLGRFAKDGEDQDRAWEDGLKAGRIASRVRKDRPEGFYWAGANLGEQSIKSPVTTGIKAVPEIRDLMNSVISIDPSFEGGAAYDVLAQVELITGLIGGKPETAVEYLEKAVELGNRDPRTRLHLAEAYLATGRVEQSRKQLEVIFSTKPEPGMEAEYELVLVKAKRMRQKRF